MKRNTLLVLAYAILFSMAAVSFSLYHTTVPVNTAIVGSKVFDISRTATVNDSQYLENTPSWMFMVFNTAAISGSDYDTNVQVALSPAVAATGLQVGIYDTNNVQLAVSAFTNGIANLNVPRQFAKGTVSKISLYLRYVYNGRPVSATNIPFAAGSVKAGVTVWGTVSPNDDQIIIDRVLANKWCSANLSPFNTQKMNIWGFVKVPVPNGTKITTEYKKIGEGTITIKFAKTTLTTGTLTITRIGETLKCEILNIDTSTYVNPNTVVIQNVSANIYNYFTISELNLNGTFYPGPYLGTSAIQTELFRNFQTNADGSFDVSFKYYSLGSNADFSIYFGYAQ